MSLIVVLTSKYNLRNISQKYLVAGIGAMTDKSTWQRGIWQTVLVVVLLVILGMAVGLLVLFQTAEPVPLPGSYPSLERLFKAGFAGSITILVAGIMAYTYFTIVEPSKRQAVSALNSIQAEIYQKDPKLAYAFLSNIKTSRAYRNTALLNFFMLILLLIAVGLFMIFAGQIAKFDFGQLNRSSGILSQIESRESVLDKIYASEIEAMRNDEIDSLRVRLDFLDSAYERVNTQNKQLLDQLKNSSGTKQNPSIDSFPQSAGISFAQSAGASSRPKGILERRKDDLVLVELTKSYGATLYLESTKGDELEKKDPLMYAAIIRVSVLLVSMFLATILINLYKYNAKLASIHFARAIAMICDFGNPKHFLEKVASISSEHVDVGRPPRHPIEYVTQLMERGLGWNKHGDEEQTTAPTTATVKKQTRPSKPK